MKKNKIIQGDALEELKKLPDESVDMVVTSPPYNVGIDYDEWDDEMHWNEYYKWCENWMGELYRVLKKDGRFCLNHYLSLGDAKKREATLMNLNYIACNKIGFRHHGVAVWTDETLTKRTAWGSWLSARAPYVNSPYEGILILFKEQWRKEQDGESTIGKDEFMEATSGIWDIPTDKKRLTPATFPKELPARCIKLLSYREDLILDPFIGSGTTAVAAKELGRDYLGIEISENYIEIAQDRLAQQQLL